MTTDFDAIVIGAGPGGEVAASRLLAGGLLLALVERELIGGGMRLLGVHPVQDPAAPGRGPRRGRRRRRAIHAGPGLVEPA